MIRSVRAIGGGAGAGSESDAGAGAGAGRILLADVGMVPPGRSELVPETMARQTLVATQRPGYTGHTAGEVRIALFQNTPTALHMDPAYRAALFEELTAAYLERGALPL